MIVRDAVRASVIRHLAPITYKYPGGVNANDQTKAHLPRQAPNAFRQEGEKVARTTHIALSSEDKHVD